MIAQRLMQSRTRGLHWHKPPAPAIESLPLPPTLLLPVAQTAGRSARILVAHGDQVLRGQPLTASQDYDLVITHASTSGIIRNIQQQSITLEPDGLEQTIEHNEASIGTREQLIECAHHFGIIGHGGAGFPLAIKLQNLSRSPDLLLVNAAECDPLIQCDDALIQRQAIDIVSTLIQVATACNIKTVVIGIEEDKPDAINALQQVPQEVCKSIELSITTVPALYPGGAEKLLLELCTGKQIPTAHNLASAGILSMNIATCYALGTAIINGHAPTSRITTVVTPDGVSRNFKLLIGTPTSHLYKNVLSESYKNDNASAPLKITEGGRMMHTDLHYDSPITQRSNCVEFTLARPATPPTPCIRCSACSDVCPVRLMPQSLHTAAIHFNSEQLESHRLDQCIECGCCDAVCPSQIPLTARFKTAKQQTRLLHREQQEASLAKQRYEKREQRLANEQAGKRKKRLKEKETSPTAQSRKDLIAQALARSGQKKNAAFPNKESDR